MESEPGESTKVLGVHRSEREPEKVAEYKPVSPLTLHEALRADGEEELARSASSLVWSGVAGGLSLGLSMVAAGLLHAHLPDAPWRVLVTSLGFSLGFVVVMVGRQGLVTESSLTGVIPVLTRHRGLGKLLRLWACVLSGNAVGVALFALVPAHTELFSGEAREAFTTLGIQALEPRAGTQFLRALMAGWLVTLALWASPSAGGSRVLVIILLTSLVGLAHLGHVVSGSVEVLTAVAMGRAGFADFLGRFFVPVLLGNLLGGTLLVAGLNHLQVRQELRPLLPRVHGRAAAPRRERTA